MKCSICGDGAIDTFPVFAGTKPFTLQPNYDHVPVCEHHLEKMIDAYKLKKMARDTFKRQATRENLIESYPSMALELKSRAN